MNVSKKCYTIFTRSTKAKKDYDFKMNGLPIHHDPQPRFLLEWEAHEVPTSYSKQGPTHHSQETIRQSLRRALLAKRLPSSRFTSRATRKLTCSSSTTFQPTHIISHSWLQPTNQLDSRNKAPPTILCNILSLTHINNIVSAQQTNEQHTPTLNHSSYSYSFVSNTTTSQHNLSQVASTSLASTNNKTTKNMRST